VRAYLEYRVSTPEYRVSTLAAQLFPDHPNLLASTWEPTAAMRADGYVTKPVSGRSGAYPVSTYPTRLHPRATDAVASILLLATRSLNGRRAFALHCSSYSGSPRRRARAYL
jgi:hypothetical protein